MRELIEFLSFSNPNVRVVTLGTMFIGMSAAMVGSFAFLRKRSLIGDAIAHAILPGIAIAFMVTQSKSPYILMFGALISGWAAMLLIEAITKHSKLKPDTAIGLVLSVFFGVGILFLTHIQHSGAGNQAGLDQFLFGKAASMTQDDLKAYSIVAGILLVVVFFLFKEFKLLSFNAEFAQISGLPVRNLQFVLSSITVLAIATGIQAVGVVLMAALIITPAAAARSWTENLVKLLFIAGFAGMLSGFVGSYISFTAPNMPTGPWIVMTLSAIAIVSLVFAPGRGLWSKMRRQRQNREKILTENILKAIYHLSERRDETFPVIDEEALQQIRQFHNDELTRGLRLLKKRYLLLQQSTGFRLSEEGLREAARVVRLHRLWEMYLTQRMRLKADHIHPNAETIEHIISPEIEEELLRELGYPDKDPHESPIPYR
jgi:manganese/zinc/iron transport system permease protein